MRRIPIPALAFPGLLPLPLLLLLLVPLPSCLGAEKAGKGEPTSDEELALIRLNQYRADLKAADEDISEAIRQHDLGIEINNFNFCKIGKGSAPPLVFDRELNLTAHALLAQQIKAVDKQHYDATEALTKAGYAPASPYLVMIVEHARTLAIASEMAIANVVGEAKSGPTSMRPVFIYQEAMKPVFREAGIAIGGQPGDFNMIIVLGAGSAARYLGGVAYLDANHDGRYQPGEGQAGVLVSCGAASMTTTASGAWWLALDSSDAADLTFASQKLALTLVRHIDQAGPKAPATPPATPPAKAPAPAKPPAPAKAKAPAQAPALGPANLVFNWRIPPKKDLALADRLIASTKRDIDGKDDEHQRPLLMKLLIGTRMTILDDDRRDQISQLVAPVQDDFDDLLHQVVTALEEDPDEVQKRFGVLEKRWKPVMPKWLKEAEHLVEMHQEVTTYLAATKDQMQSMRSEVVGDLTKCLATTNDPAFLEQYLSMLGMVDRKEAMAIGSRKLDRDPPPPAAH